VFLFWISMPTEIQNALLLLAHQDDEFAAQKLIEDAVEQGVRVFCAFLTMAPDVSVNARRNQESLRVLSRLGVAAQDVFFVGEQLNVLDGRMACHLNDVAIWVQRSLTDHEPVHIWIPAWEGGHPDHDALHAVVVEVAAKVGLLERVLQFPLYNGWRCVGPWFRVLQPLPENGPVFAVSLSWAARWRYLCNCLSYPSQLSTWVGLFPFVLLRMVFHGVQSVQGVSRQRLVQRPHEGRLYYESRRFASWGELSGQVLSWMRSL